MRTQNLPSLELPAKSGSLDRVRVSYQALGALLGSTEALVTVLSSCACQLLFQHFWMGQTDLSDAIGIGILATLTFVSFARSAGLYRLPAILRPQRILGKFVGYWGTSYLLLATVLFLLKSDPHLARGYFLMFGCLTPALLFILRLMTSSLVRSLIKRGAIAGRVAIVIGDKSELDRLTAHSLLYRFGITEVGRVSLNTMDDTVARSHAFVRALMLARQMHAEEFVLAVGWEKTELLTLIRNALRFSPLPVRLLPDRGVRSMLGKGPQAEKALGPAMTIEVQRAPMSLGERAIKRALDISAAMAAIFILAPVFIFTALAIKMNSPGPIIFRQRRNGFNEQQFTIYKFRSMHVLEDGAQVIQAQRQDPRVTSVGRILRRTSIDELPQLFNVLKGDMSLVGPRPHAMAHDDQYKRLIETYCCRHHVKPGLTGWAQVNGCRGETKDLMHMRQRVDLDLWYITHWSLLIDLKILFRTCFEVLKHDAY